MKLVIYEHDRACPCGHPLDEDGEPVGPVVGCHVNIYPGETDDAEGLMKLLDGRHE